MSMPLFLDSFAALLPTGMYSPQGHVLWKPDQRAPEDVDRSQVLDKPYPGFGKLQIADKLAFSAVSLMLRTCTVTKGQECGICIGNATGSLSTDFRYWESVIDGFPSPSIFSATLPSSPVTDIAIYFGLKGPNRVIAGQNASGICALSEAMMILNRKKATTMLVISLNALEGVDRHSRLVPALLQPSNRAYSFMITSKKNDCGLGLQISAQFDVAQKTLHDDSQGEHFDRFIDMLMKKQYGRMNFAIEDYSGFISIEKDA